MIDNNNTNFSDEERKVADQVADEILTVPIEENDKRYLILLLLFLICLIFLVSSVSFSVIDTYNNSDSMKNKAVDVDVDVDKCTVNCDTNGDGVCDKNCNNKKTPNGKKDDNIVENPTEENDKPNHEKEKPDHDKEHEPIQPGTILFSYTEGSSYINIVNAFPTTDSEGKKLSGNKEYFDFNVSVDMIKKNKPVTYEISAVPINGNTLSNSEIRVYLTESDKPVSVNDRAVNTFSALPNSKFNKNGKVLYKKTVTKDFNGSYVFRMWIDSKVELTNVSKKFGCKIVVNGYYED